MEHGAKYTLYSSLSSILDVILFLTIGVLAVFILELITPVTSGMSLVTVMLVFSFALSACIALLGSGVLGYIVSRVSLKWASKMNIGTYFVFTVIFTFIIWIVWFW